MRKTARYNIELNVAHPGFARARARAHRNADAQAHVYRLYGSLRTVAFCKLKPPLSRPVRAFLDKSDDAFINVQCASGAPDRVLIGVRACAITGR